VRYIDTDSNLYDVVQWDIAADMGGGVSRLAGAGDARHVQSTKLHRYMDWCIDTSTIMTVVGIVLLIWEVRTFVWQGHPFIPGMYSWVQSQHGTFLLSTTFMCLSSSIVDLSSSYLL
jgi:hypothetical protein